MLYEIKLTMHERKQLRKLYGNAKEQDLLNLAIRGWKENNSVATKEKNKSQRPTFNFKDK